MRLYEYEAADIFERYGISVPERCVVSSPEEAVDAAVRIGCPVMLKAQILLGGRGLAGGVVAASTPDEAKSAAGRLLSAEIRGERVRRLLVAKKVAVARELYLGITIDGYSGHPVAIAGAEGGTSIEEIAKRNPERLISSPFDPAIGLMPYRARNILCNLGFAGKELVGIAGLFSRLGQVFLENEALIAEINPLAVLEDGSLCALDAKLEIDDSALFRLGGRIPANEDRIGNDLERRGKEIGVTYVDLDGDIGVVSSGAGLGMATMDIIAQRLRPANFLETGGGITETLMYDTMDLILRKKGIRAIFITIYGGINPIHEGAKGIVRYLREHNPGIPVVAKALGNRQEETWDILRSGGVHVVTGVSTEQAVAELIDILGG